MPAKKTIDHCIELAASKGGYCLSSEYVNSVTKLKWKCAIGHIWFQCYNRIHSGNWCPECNSKPKYSICDVKRYANSRGGFCLSENYINGNTKLGFVCQFGHKWETSWVQMQHQKTWCPKCVGKQRISKEETVEIAKQFGYDYVSGVYLNSNTKLEFRCQNQHTFLAAYKTLKRGHGCSKCSGTQKLSIYDCRSVAESRNGKCLSEEYKNSSSYMIWECSKGHIWKAKFQDIKISKSWCPECMCTQSRGEKQVLDFVKNNFPNLVVESKDRKTIKNKNTNKFLELDIYLPTIGFAIEYNGDYWHSKKMPGYHRNKTNLCAEKGIKLLHIKESAWIHMMDIVKMNIVATINGIIEKKQNG